MRLQRRLTLSPKNSPMLKMPMGREEPSSAFTIISAYQRLKRGSGELVPAPSRVVNNG
jgi:hypothetical protein